MSMVNPKILERLNLTEGVYLSNFTPDDINNLKGRIVEYKGDTESILEHGTLFRIIDYSSRRVRCISLMDNEKIYMFSENAYLL